MPRLQPRSCHAWWVRPSSIDLDLGQLLDTDEQARLVALRSQADRDRFAAGCAVVRLGLATYLRQPPATIAITRSCPACGRPHGKPRLSSPGPPIHLSVSHSGDRVAVVFALGTPLGVDVEAAWLEPELPVEDLAQDALTAAEAMRLTALQQGQRVRGFLRYWTRKEAVLKATGHGLAVPMQTLSVSGPDEPPELILWPRVLNISQPVTLFDLDPGPGYMASLAAIGSCSEPLAVDGSTMLVEHGLARWR